MPMGTGHLKQGRLVDIMRVSGFPKTLNTDMGTASLVYNNVCGYYKAGATYQKNHIVYYGSGYWRSLQYGNKGNTPNESAWWTAITDPGVTWGAQKHSESSPNASVSGYFEIILPRPITLVKLAVLSFKHQGRQPEEGGSYGGSGSCKLNTGSGYGSDIWGSSGQRYLNDADTFFEYTTKTPNVQGIKFELVGWQSGGIQPAGGYIELDEIEVWTLI